MFSRDFGTAGVHDVYKERMKMNVRECYEIMNGDYEDVKRRFLSDTRIRKFALLFLGDNSMEELREAMGCRNREKGFQAAHTLKGICLNLGFAGLFVPVNRITEMLRAGFFEKAEKEMLAVEEAFEKTMKGLHELEKL